MDVKQLKEVLEQHCKWLADPETGGRADLRGADLQGADLRGANLCRADLEEANLYRANLLGADLRGAYLRGADLYRADLRGADLQGADLLGADLEGANLRGANLQRVKGILGFYLGEHFGFSYQFDGQQYIQLGCEHHTVDEWLVNYREIGSNNDYSKFHIKQYWRQIKLTKKWWKDYNTKAGE